MKRLVRQRAHFHAWLVTGPPGHLWSALADIAIIWARYLAHRVRSRGRATVRGRRAPR